MSLADFDSRSSVQSGVQSAVQVGLSDDERDMLDNPPPSHRLTLDGHCALAASRDQVVLYDLEGGGLRYVDPTSLDPRGWVS